MNIEDIKIGKTYLLPFEVLKINDTDIHMRNGGVKGIFQPEELTEISSPTPPIAPTGGMLHKSDDDWATKGKNLFNLLNGRANTETPPKYAPCRKFRKGDRVRVAENKGRCLKPYTLKIGDVLTVSMDEPNNDTCVIVCKWHDQDFYLDPAYLELVTPVEEMEPYSVVDAHTHWDVADKNMKTVATYSKAYHPNPKAAAEAERDRLNAEYRKEQA